MRNWLRRWLGVTKIDKQWAETQTEINIFNDRLERFNVTLNELEHDRYQSLVDDIMTNEFRINELKQEFAALKTPHKQKLLQLKSGLDTLTKFANELQREIEK